MVGILGQLFLGQGGAEARVAFLAEDTQSLIQNPRLEPVVGRLPPQAVDDALIALRADLLTEVANLPHTED